MKFEVVQEKPKPEEDTIVMWLESLKTGVALYASKKGREYDARRLAEIGESGIYLCNGVQGYLGIAADESNNNRIKLIS